MKVEVTLERLSRLACYWRVMIEDLRETESSILAFGRRDRLPVALKVLKPHSDEWRAGQILSAFKGKGAVRIYEQTEGALLLERARPGDPLSTLVLAGHDDRATDILAQIIHQLHANRRRTIPATTTVEDWAPGFERYLESGQTQIPGEFVEHARDIYLELCRSQKRPRLLHGDLHHENVLFDSERGWLAIDPKGVVGELEYEIGAALRNPIDRPDLFLSSRIVQRRIERFRKTLALDAERILRWGFAQAVLSAIWSWEDGMPFNEKHPCLLLAREMLPLLP